MAVQLVRRCLGPWQSLRNVRSSKAGLRLWMYPCHFKCTSQLETIETKWASPTKDDIHVRSEKQDVGIEFTGKLFSEFPLSQDLLSRLQSLGIERTFEVQDKTLPLTLEGRDVIGRAITGSGKTLAFALPIVHILSKSERSRHPRALVITPTRELCNQVTKSVQDLSYHVRCVSIYGGDSYARQERELSRGMDVVCSTPGRLNDHLKRGSLSLKDVQFLVLDEADELLTPNFLNQIGSVLSDCPSDKQMMLFSATMPPDIKHVASRYMKNPVMVDLVSNRSLVPQSVVHEALKVPNHLKTIVVASLLMVNKPRRAIVFTSSRASTTDIAQELHRLGIQAQPISSDLTQMAREKCLADFRAGHTNVLVATDVAARGIDVPETDMVIQVDPPPSGIDFYIHRSGRTGRKGQSGRSILVLASDANRRSYTNTYPDDFLQEMKRNKIKFQIISPPAEDEIISAIMDHACARLSNVNEQTIQATKPHAEKVLESMDPVSAVAAALAVLGDLNVEKWRKIKEDMRRSNRYSRGGTWRNQEYSDSYKRRGGHRSGGRDGRWQDDHGSFVNERRSNRRFGGRRERDNWSSSQNSHYGSHGGGGRFPRDKW